MAMTVTATASGGTATCASFALAVLTGAAATQNGATSAGVPVPATAIITPVATGSIVFGALLAYPGSADPTPTAATTLWPGSYSSGAGGAAYGSFYSTSKTTSGTPVTLGASAPAGEFNALAMAEVLASGTLTIDVSTPAAQNSGFLSSLTTASFTPPAGALLVAQAAAVSSTIAISDSLGLTWANLALSGETGIWIARVPAAPRVGCSAIPAFMTMNP